MNTFLKQEKLKKLKKLVLCKMRISAVLCFSPAGLSPRMAGHVFFFVSLFSTFANMICS